MVIRNTQEAIIIKAPKLFVVSLPDSVADLAHDKVGMILTAATTVWPSVPPPCL